MSDQLSLFPRKKYTVSQPVQPVELARPSGEQTVMQTLLAYHAYVRSVSTSRYTPDDFVGDMKKLAVFLPGKAVQDITRQDLDQWIASLRKFLSAKSVSRKIAALLHYFFWLETTEVIMDNPAVGIRNRPAASPLPEVLFSSECDRLLRAASGDPRLYFLILLLLSTGITREELMSLKMTSFDFSNKYAPEVWIKHTGAKIKKDRLLKLPAEIRTVYDDYAKACGIDDVLFPYSDRFIRMLLTDVARAAGITKAINIQILRDSYAVQLLKSGIPMNTVLTKLGLDPKSDDGREKYERLAARAI